MSGARPARLLFAFHEEFLNGATIAVLRLIEPLRQLGWESVFWVPQPGPAADFMRARGYEVGGRWRPVGTSVAAFRQPPGVARRLAATPPYLAAFSRFVRAQSPDVIHANSLYSFAEGLVGRALGVPTVLHLHDMAPTSWKADPVRWMTRRAFDQSVAVSLACASSYSVRGWRPWVVRGAAPIPDQAAPIRPDPSPFVVGTVGVISKRKGSDVFVAAAETLRRSRPDLEFRMVGSASEPLDREWASDVLKRAKAAGVVYMERTDVEREMRNWDAVVLPSRRDPFPLVVLEAMAAGLPVIASSVDGIPEQIGSDGGVLVDADDAPQLADAIGQISMMSVKERARLGSAARSRASSRFTIGRQASEMHDVYQAALDGRAP